MKHFTHKARVDIWVGSQIDMRGFGAEFFWVGWGSVQPNTPFQNTNGKNTLKRLDADGAISLSDMGKDRHTLNSSECTVT